MGFIGGLLSFGTIMLIEKNRAKHLKFQENQIPVSNVANFSNLPANMDFKNAAEMTVHAVVHIKTEYQQKNNLYDDFFGFSDPFKNFFYGNPGNSMRQAPLQASGSGVIITDDGYIVTNNHVVQDASFIEVTLNDKRTYTGKLVGSDPSTDLALIKIEEAKLPFIVFGNSDSLKLGEWVLAVGNPFNLTSTVTAGIVSAKARNINILGGGSNVESFIQTDAAVNPGNSGGALVNTAGQLIGINAAIASNTGSYTGYSFAIPSNIVRKVMNDLMEFGQIQRAFMGLGSIQEVDGKFAQEKGLEKVKGVYISTLDQNGAAFEAGIQAGDVIMKIDEKEVNSTSELQEVISRHRPGDKINVAVDRIGKGLSFDIVLKNKNGNTKIVKQDETNVISLLGATFEPIGDQEKNSLRIQYGLKIIKLEGGKLRGAGIREGFIVTAIDKKPIKTTEDINTALQGKAGMGVLIEGIYTNGMRAYYGFGL
ncbi:MAG: trypsin-like peptidase domain-containing protein [Bacteroidetes bacterium]|nr:trypsin-like peptidase domain-containing protein [Bacteroidota bacterium]